MAKSKRDPTEPMRLRASRYPGVDQGTVCTQASFKAGKKSFFFVGMQGGRHKAMFKLEKSIPEARKLAAREPDRYGVGTIGWVTARFTAEEPMPTKVWQKWMDESYALSLPKGKTKSTASSTKKKVTKKKVAKKKVARKKTVRKR